MSQQLKEQLQGQLAKAVAGKDIILTVLILPMRD